MLSRLGLREYQQAAVSAVVGQIEDGCRLLVTIPTGGGKTRVIAGICSALPAKQVLVVTTRKRLLKQARDTLVGSEVGVLSSSYGEDTGHKHRVLVCTAQTLLKREEVKAPDIVLFDEAHLLPKDGAFELALQRFPGAALIGLTATPYRQNVHLQRLQMGWKEVFSVGILELISDKYLVPPVSIATKSTAWGGIDSDDRLLRTTSNIVSQLAEAVKGSGRRKCVVFCKSIPHAKATVELLRKNGAGNVYLVHSELSSNDGELEAFEKSTEIAWLVNVYLVGIGVDIPAIDTVAILRDVGSFAVLAQMIGRGLRPFGTKRDCHVYDFGFGTERFGFIDSPRLPSFTDSAGPGEGLQMKMCPRCTTMLLPQVQVCSCCRYEFPLRLGLRDEAVETPLISSPYFRATYQETALVAMEPGFVLAHHFVATNGAKVRAIEHLGVGTPRSSPKLVPGCAYMVRSIAGDVVRRC